MLVLSRKVGETIQVPEYDLAFTVLEIRGDKVVVGVSAPRKVEVFRQEIWERIQRKAGHNNGGDHQPVVPDPAPIRH